MVTGVGRVGGLAAALGVGLGLALCAGSGIASADTTDSPAADSTRSASTRSSHVAHSARPARVAPAHRQTSSPAARAVTAPVTSKGITVNPSVALVDGIVRGTLNATNSRGLPMTFTSLDGSSGGKLDLGTVGGDPQSYTALPYATWVDTGAKGVETFSIRIGEITPVDQFLTSIPLIGFVADPVINLLQQLPLISDLLIPIIGASVVARVDVDVAALAPGDTPLAFTYRVISFDGTPISTNFFPAAGLAAGGTAPTVLDGPGLGDPGVTDPYEGSGTADSVPGVRLMRNAGFNVVTWDPRGEYASGGVMQLDSPFYEGRDVSAIISWIAQNAPAELDGPSDPKVGMIGGSYGGGIQLATASTDPRIEAIAPSIAWNSLNSSLYPYGAFKFAWANILLAFLFGANARVSSQVYEGILTGDLFGRLGQASQAMLASSGSTSLLNQLKAPTLLVQGTVDGLFPPGEAVTNAQAIMANPHGTPVKMVWFCGGHGLCEDPENPAQRSQIFADTIAWMRQYVAGDGQPADDIPAFQWYDQRGGYFSADLLPFQDGFDQAQPYRVTGRGGTLGILPILGGSNGFFTSAADNAINVAAEPSEGSQIVGAPQLSFSYQGLGTSRTVYAQLVDNATGRVVGNMVSPIPVVLDGRARTVSVPMTDVAYTVGAGDSLTLQITSSALLYANSSVGVIKVSGIQLDLPLRRL